MEDLRIIELVYGVVVSLFILSMFLLEFKNKD